MTTRNGSPIDHSDRSRTAVVSKIKALISQLEALTGIDSETPTGLTAQQLSLYVEEEMDSRRQIERIRAACYELVSKDPLQEIAVRLGGQRIEEPKKKPKLRSTNSKPLTRHLRGEQHPMHKLSEEKVRNIKRLLQAGCPMQALAEEHGVSVSTISSIRYGSAWRWVK